jgi:uncharacterized membrane protein
VVLYIAGLLLFLVPHLLPVVPPLRNALFARFGERSYKGAFSLLSAVGLVLIVVGYIGSPTGPQLFAPKPWAIAIAPYAVTLAFVLFALANMPSHIRAAIKHPMLIGLLIWSGVHLLANGDTRGTLLFGSFFAYAVIDLVSAIARGATRTFVPRARADVMGIVGGVVIALIVMTLHRVIFGHAVVPFGL